jgi:hypothetical protein
MLVASINGGNGQYEVPLGAGFQLGVGLGLGLLNRLARGRAGQILKYADNTRSLSWNYSI